MAFGKPIAEHEGVGFMIADNEMDLTQSRLAIRHAAWLLDQGHHARHETSMVKVLCSEALFRVADRCVQVLGGRGLTADTVVERAFRDIRAFRVRSEEHTSELQSLMRISYAVFCLKKKNIKPRVH